jgi:hypothetical protein
MRRLSSVDVHGHQGHGAAMMRVATCDTVTTLGEDETVDDADMADDGDTDETRVATSSLSLYEKAKADGITDETAISYEDEEVATPKTDEDTSDEKRKSDVVVRESGELEVLESAAYSLMEWEIGIAR